MGGRGKCVFQMETNTIKPVFTIASLCVHQLVTVPECRLKQWEMALSED